MRVIAYTRVSTEEQARQGHSPDQQIQAARAYCEIHGHELADIIEDRGVSGSRAFETRPGGARLMRRIAAGDCEGVVILRWDRMFRDTLDGLQFLLWLSRQDCAIHSIHDHVDTSKPEGKLQLTILLATAQYERDKIAQRASQCSTSLREQGRAWGGVPFGCVRIGDDIYRDPATWQQREHVLLLRRQGRSLRAIAWRLQEDGIPSPTGRRRWSVHTVKRILDTHSDIEAIPFLPQKLEAAASEGARA